MLNVLTMRGRKKRENKIKKKRPKPKGCKETAGSFGYVYYLDCGSGVMGVCICPDSSNCTH